MELKDILKDKGIIGVIGNYKSNVVLDGKVKDLNIKNINKGLKLVGLDDTYLEKNVNELTINELWKIELLTKLKDKCIIVGNLSSSLNYKDGEFIKKLFIKLVNDYKIQIVVIDKDITAFFNLTKDIFVLENNKVIYQTNNYFDDELYKYVNMPKIIEFIKYINNNGKNIQETVDIYELIKDIYRRAS
mgnify:CR=1 FL=1